MNKQQINVLFAATTAAVLAVCPAISRAELTMQRDAPTTRFYTPDGKSAGAATTYANTTKFYAPSGSLIGSAIRNNERK